MHRLVLYGMCDSLEFISLSCFLVHRHQSSWHGWLDRCPSHTICGLQKKKYIYICWLSSGSFQLPWKLARDLPGELLLLPTIWETMICLNAMLQSGVGLDWLPATAILGEPIPPNIHCFLRGQPYDDGVGWNENLAHTPIWCPRWLPRSA